MGFGELLLAAVALGGQSEPVPDICEEGRGWIPLAGVPRIVRQGDRVAVEYGRTHGPDGTHPFSATCLKDWRISDSRVTMSPDRMTVLVPADLPPGTEVTITAAYGSRSLRFGFKVLGRDEQTLAGVWHEKSREHCEGRQIAELVLSVDGSYSVTVPEHMVETMVTDSGQYRWDAVTGTFEMGDAQRFHWRGRAIRKQGELLIEGVNPTGFQNDACRITLSGG